MNKIRIGILGGDYRYKLMKELLQADGYIVHSYCNRFIDGQTNSLDELLEMSDVAVGPIPCSRNGRSIALNDCSEIEIGAFFTKLKEYGVSRFFCGVVNDILLNMSKKNNIEIYDFFAMDEVAIKNAVPTAEGAVQTAMQESNRTIFGSRALVLGYGKCGRVLTNTLKGIGAEVTAACRKPADNAAIFAFGITPIYFKELKNSVSGFDFIFNTVPAQIIDKEILECMDKRTIIIDLAQAPGGTDYNAAAELGIKALYCPGLPGRVAPLTAAEILKDALISSL